MSNEFNRRESDVRLTALERDMVTVKADLGTIKAEVAKNTEITEDIRTLLKSFKLIAAAGKYLGMFAGGLAGAYAAWRQLRG